MLKPRLPDGKYPLGFLGFAVNMIDLDHNYLIYHTVKGHGLREILFYSMFAIPCISEGAISLDGVMIKANGLYLSWGQVNHIPLKC